MFTKVRILKEAVVVLLQDIGPAFARRVEGKWPILGRIQIRIS
jgi:hypothetical protein